MDKKNIQNILNKSDLSYIRLYQSCISEKWLSNVVKMNSIHQFKQTSSTSVDNSSKALKYRLYQKGISLLSTIEMNLHNLLSSTSEFEHIKAQYFTVFGLHLYFWGINLALSCINSVHSTCSL
jgi:hypothetical protein